MLLLVQENLNKPSLNPKSKQSFYSCLKKIKNRSKDTNDIDRIKAYNPATDVVLNKSTAEETPVKAKKEKKRKVEDAEVTSEKKKKKKKKSEEQQ